MGDLNGSGIPIVRATTSLNTRTIHPAFPMTSGHLSNINANLENRNFETLMFALPQFQKPFHAPLNACSPGPGLQNEFTPTETKMWFFEKFTIL